VRLVFCTRILQHLREGVVAVIGSLPGHQTFPADADALFHIAQNTILALWLHEDFRRLGLLFGFMAEQTLCTEWSSPSHGCQLLQRVEQRLFREMIHNRNA